MIRVLIERRLIEQVDTFAYEALRELRHEAIKKPGYISGETLRNIDDPNHYVVISSWQSREDWDAWCQSEERLRTDEQLRAVLTEPEKITVFEMA